MRSLSMLRLAARAPRRSGPVTSTLGVRTDHLTKGTQMHHHREAIRLHLASCASELLAYLAAVESRFPDRMVPAAEAKEALGLNLVAVPKSSKDSAPSGWVFGALARILEDEGKIEYIRKGSRSFCRVATR